MINVFLKREIKRGKELRNEHNRSIVVVENKTEILSEKFQCVYFDEYYRINTDHKNVVCVLIHPEGDCHGI